MTAVTPTQIVLEAIARKVCIATRYNKTPVQIAPHVLYTRHDELYVDAVTIERDGKKPKEIKLGTFKLSGLGEIALTRRGFVALNMFDPAEPRYQGTTLFAVER